MTTKKLKQKLRLYHAEYENSKRWRQKFEKNWRECLDIYRHRDPLFCGENLKKDQIQVNYAHSTIQVIMDSTLHRYPKINLMARNPNQFRNSVIAQGALNQQWQVKGWQRPLRLSMLDKLIIGHGWNKTTYQFEREELDLTEERFKSIFDEEMKALVAVAREGKRPFPTDDEVMEALDEKGVGILKDQVQVERVSPFDIFVDPGGKDMDSISWIAQRVTVNRRLFREDERFPLEARKGKDMRDELERVDALSFQGDSLVEDDMSTSMDFVQYIEFYDILDGTLSFFLEEGGEEFLIEPSPMPYSFGHPFDMMRGTEIPDVFYPIGEVDCIKDQQRELNRARTDMLNDRKKGARQYLYKPDNVDATFEEAMRSDEDELLIPVKKDVNFADVMAELPFQARIRPELYDQSALFLQDIFQLTGITDYQRGGGASARTATQVAVENDAALARQGRQLQALEENMARVARKALQLMQQFMHEKQVLRLSEVGQQFDAAVEGFEQRYSNVWFQYGREDIGGEYDVQIEAGSTRPMNDSTRAQRALQVMNAASPFLQLNLLDPAQLAVYTLRELGVPNPESWVREGTDPRDLDTSQVGPAPSVAGGVGPVGANVSPEQQPRQGQPTQLDDVRAQLQGQIGLAQ